MEAIREERDELSGPQEQFLETWRYEKQFGKADPRKITDETFRGKTMRGIWVIPEDEQGKYTSTKKCSQAVTERTTLCEMELSDNQSNETYMLSIKELLAPKDNDDAMVLCSLGGGPTLALKDRSYLSKFLTHDFHVGK